MILVVDNYDSFTYNLVQALEVAAAGEAVEVVRNDTTSVEQVERMRPRGLLLSPGPGRPEEAGISVELVRALAPRLPILGVCLGHQAVAVAFGARVVRAPEPVHGKTSPVRPLPGTGSPLYEGLPVPFEATRYHSLVVEEGAGGRPAPELEVTAVTEAPGGGHLVMGVRHRKFPCEGVQFHPESVLTPEGMKLLANWVRSLPAT
ncbi:MAG: aminodeoxychorismate/anthranilate synthase component II [Clostridia bacterium]|nr:aminodeoxychorismate/anthranilate synthase component II [Clostridia bacterium]MCL6521033.1 aminodeoxychorismate/anthranilate synthase component II [Bacillota bacterium]